MLAPGAMGESERVGNAKIPEGEAENRRVVMRVLQNKAIAGGVGVLRHASSLRSLEINSESELLCSY